MRLYGKVTDFDGNALDGAGVRVDGRGGKRAVAHAITDRNGMYEVEIERGTYSHAWICKDYKEKMLEYWAWHLPVYEDLELNARIDGIELHGMNAFWPRYGSSLMVFFRPMGLKRFRAWETTKHDEPGLIDIAPKLSPEDIEVTVDGKQAPLLGVNRVREQTPPNHMGAYLIQIQVGDVLETDSYRKITVAIADRETGERGEGSVFWRRPLYEQ